MLSTFTAPLFLSSQAHLEMSDEEKERRVEVGKLMKSWSIIKKEHKNSEFVVLWQAWLKTKDVSGVDFLEMEEALRALNIDELVVIKAQVG